MGVALLKNGQEIRKIRAEASSLEGKIKHEIIDTAYTTIKQLRAENDKLRTQRDMQRIEHIKKYDSLEAKHDAEIRLLLDDIKQRNRLLHDARVEVRKHGGDTGVLYPIDTPKDK